MLAAEVAFFSLLSLPPLLLAILGTLGYLARGPAPGVSAGVEDRIVEVAGTFLTPSTVSGIVKPAVNDLLSQAGGKVISFGVVLAVWSASLATAAVVDAIRIIHNQPTPPAWRRRIGALGLTALAVVGGVLLLPVLVVGPRLGAFLAEPLGLDDAFKTAVKVLYWPIVALLGVGLLATSYRFALHQAIPWRRGLPGAALALLVWILGGFGLRLYAAGTLEATSVYGALSAPLVLLLWLYLTALAVLIGAEVNANIEWP